MKIGIVGLGLIGGSLAKAYTEAGHRVLGEDRDEKILGFAMLSGAVEAALTPYRFRKAEEADRDMVTLYTNSGTPLPVIECEEDEMRGAAHKFHFCPNKKRGERK